MSACRILSDSASSPVAAIGSCLDTLMKERHQFSRTYAFMNKTYRAVRYETTLLVGLIESMEIPDQ